MLGMLLAFSLWFTGFLVSPITIRLLQEYHVVVDALLFLFTFGLTGALTARLMLVIKPLHEGKYSMDSQVFTWWKLFTVTYDFSRGALLPFTVVFTRPLVASLLGVKMGKDVALAGHLVDPELITIGDEAIIGQDSVIAAHAINSGLLILRPVVIGSRATIGVNVVIMCGVEVGEDAIVMAGSVVHVNSKIPPGETWIGNPARLKE